MDHGASKLDYVVWTQVKLLHNGVDLRLELELHRTSSTVWILRYSLKMHSVLTNPFLKLPTHTKGFCKFVAGFFRQDTNTWWIFCPRSRALLRAIVCSSNDPVPELYTDSKIWEWGEDRTPHGSFPSFPWVLHGWLKLGELSQLWQLLALLTDFRILCAGDTES